MEFSPSNTSQNGLFTYIRQKHGFMNSTLVNIQGSVYDSSFNLFSTIDDTQSNRYVSSDTPNPSLIIEFSAYPILITHYSFHFCSNWYYMKDWNIYKISNEQEQLIAEGSAVSECKNAGNCAKNVYIVNKIDKPTVVNKIKIKQSTTRSDSNNKMEFKSFEIYGKLINLRNNSCKRKKDLACNNLLLLICLVAY